MLKKLLATSLACIMVLSSMAVVSFADTTEPTVIQEWVEDFDSYTNEQLASGVTGTLYKNFDDCAFHKVADRSRHYEFSNGWYMKEPAGSGSSFIGDYEFKDAYGGKAKGDKHFHLIKGHGENHNIMNIFGNEPIDFSGNAKAVEFSFDWFDDGSAAGEGKRCAAPAYVVADVVITSDGTTGVDATLNFGTFMGYNFTSSLNNKVTANPEMWNGFTMYLSEDTVKIKVSASTNEITMNLSDYDVDASKWVSGANSGAKILKVKNVKYTIVRNSGNFSPYSSFGIDNLKAATLTAMPASIDGRLLPYFVNFKGINHAPSTVEHANLYFMNANQGGTSTNVLSYALSETTIDNSTGRIDVDVLSSDTNAAKTTGNSEATTFADGYVKISNKECDKISGSPLAYLRVNNTDLASPALNDKLQYSFDFKYSGNESAKSLKAIFNLEAMISTGAGKVINIAGDGTVFDSAPLAKLKADTWYSFDTMYELTSEGTVVNVYLDGNKILSKTLTGEFDDDLATKYTLRHTYSCEVNSEGTAYLPNSVCLDNLCYQIFKGGANAFNFDKSASAADNKVIANADVDFVNSTIFPVAADFTVADFKDLGLTNATVLNDDKETEAADGDALAGKVIKFTGDYGKDVYYTVSSEGGANVSKSSFVTIRENLGAEFVTSATAGKLLTAKAVKDNENLEIYIAEYTNNELVGLTIGDGVVNYIPKTAGNEIKVFIWVDGSLVPAFTGEASTLSVN